MRNYGGIANNQLLTFAEWFNLYCNRENKQEVPRGGLALSRQDYIPAPITII